MLNSYKNESRRSVGNTPLNTGINLPATVGATAVAVREPILNKLKQFSRDAFPIEKFTRNRILSTLPVEDFSRLLPHMQSINVASGENIYHSGDSGYYIYFPETAVFSQLNVLEDGRTVETAMIGCEGILGISTILSSQPHSTPWTQAVIEGNVFRVNASIIKQEFHRGSFLHLSFLEYLNLYIQQISQKVVCNNHHLVEERFSSWLLMLDDRGGDNKLVLTHEQIAHFLGVHRPSVTCIAQDLRHKGIINYCRGRIYILDRKQLERTACECYATLN